MKATIAAAIFLVFYVFATPSVAAPASGSDSEAETLQQILGDFGVSEDRHVPKRSCYHIMVEEQKNESGVYPLKLQCGEVNVYCDMTLQGGGWTVIMKRNDGSVNFNRNWRDYVNGFGSFGTEFFLGLQTIHELTLINGNMELWIGFRSHEEVHEPYRKASFVYKFARYGHFKVSGPDDDYTLTVNNYDESSTAGDSFSSHNDAKFSTADRDSSGKHCAEENKSGWWFYNNNVNSHSCHDCNLDGVWKQNGRNSDDPNAKDGIVWQSWKGDEYSLKNVIMAIRPVL